MEVGRAAEARWMWDLLEDTRFESRLQYYFSHNFSSGRLLLGSSLYSRRRDEVEEKCG